MTDIVERLLGLDADEISVARMRTDAALEIERLRARVAKLEARLEIDHYWMSAGDEEPMARVEVPPEERDQQVDGIECRDETIKGQDERIGKQSAEIERLSAALREEKSASSLMMAALEDGIEIVSTFAQEGSRLHDWLEFARAALGEGASGL